MPEAKESFARWQLLGEQKASTSERSRGLFIDALLLRPVSVTAFATYSSAKSKIAWKRQNPPLQKVFSLLSCIQGQVLLPLKSGQPNKHGTILSLQGFWLQEPIPVLHQVQSVDVKAGEGVGEQGEDNAFAKNDFLLGPTTIVEKSLSKQKVTVFCWNDCCYSWPRSKGLLCRYSTLGPSI